MSKITASIVLYKTPEIQLIRLLECIHEASVCDQIFLIDNSPTPLDIPISFSSLITYIKSEGNIGYGAGHNTALRLAIKNSEFHFVINPDIYFSPGSLSNMIMRIKQDSSIGQLMPKVTYPDGRLQYLCKLIPTPLDLIFRRFLVGPLRSLAAENINRFELRHMNYDQEMDVPYLSGCFMLFRTAALHNVGIFDERFFMYPEDIDITRRVHKNYRTLYYPGASIIHDHARESYKSKKMLLVHIWNIIKYFNKWGWFHDPERNRVNAYTLRKIKENIIVG